MLRHLGRLRGCCWLFALALACAAGLSATDVKALPAPTGYVSDLAHVLSPADREQLEAFCTRVEQELGVQFALVTVDTIGDADIREYALDLFRKWGVGSKKTNQGVLLLLAVNDHKSDIETGRGIEPYLTDGFSGSTLRAMRPQLRAAEYGPALLTAAQSMAAQIASGKGIAFTGATPAAPEQPAVSASSGGHRFPIGLILLGVFLLIWLLGRGGRRGGGAGGFLTGMLVGNLLGGGDRYRGGWGDGGGFGNGSGGGGFGGFGGGDAGGGGASSNW